MNTTIQDGGKRKRSNGSNIVAVWILHKWFINLYIKYINRNILVAKYVLLFTTNSAIASYSGQFFCLWSTKNLKYCSNSWFMYFVCLSVCRWKDTNNFILIPNILFSFLVNSASNCGPLSEITLSFLLISLLMFLLLLPPNELFWTTCCVPPNELFWTTCCMPPKLCPFLLLMATL